MRRGLVILALLVAAVPAVPAPAAAAQPPLQLADLPPGWEPLPPGPAWYSEWYTPRPLATTSAQFERPGPRHPALPFAGTRLRSTVATFASPDAARQALPLSLGHQFPAPDWLDPPMVGDEAVLWALRGWEDESPRGFELLFRAGRHLARILVLGPDASTVLLIDLGQKLAARLDADGGPARARPNESLEVRVWAAVQRVRGLPARGPVAVARLAGSDGGPPRAAADDYDLAWQRLLDLLGQRASADCPERETPPAHVYGYYLPGQSRVVLYGAADQRGPDLQLVLAHELTHALGDQHFNLTRLRHGTPALQPGDDLAGGSDAETALLALIEGDALVVSDLYARSALGPAGYAAWRATIERGPSGLDCLPPLRRAQLWFPYLDGWRFVAALRSAGGWESVNGAYARPPQTTEQVLHPEKYRAGEAGLALPAPTLPAGWQAERSDVLGELGIRAVLATFIDPTRAEGAAAGWGGDRLTLASQGDRDALVLDTLWDSAGEASEFFALAAEALDRRVPAVRRPAEPATDALTWNSATLAARLERADARVRLVIAADPALPDLLTLATAEPAGAAP